MGNIKSFYQDPKVLEGLIHSAAKDSENIYFPAKAERKIVNVAISEVFACLERGAVTNHPEPDEYKNIICEMKLFHAGREIVLNLVVVPETNHVIFLYAEG